MSDEPTLNDAHAEPPPAVTIYAAREPDGSAVPIVAAVNGFALPILDGAIEFSANGSKRGTRRMTATVTFLISGGGVVEVGGPEDVPELEPLVA